MVKKNSNEIKKVAKKTTKKSKVVTKIEEKNTEENETSNELEVVNSSESIVEEVNLEDFNENKNDDTDEISLVKAENNEILSQYIRKVSSFPMLTQEEETELFNLYIDKGDQKAGQAIVLSHLRLVVKIAMQYRKFGLNIMDVIAEGNVGLMIALQKFDRTKNARFSTYAGLWIKAKVQEFILKSWSLIKVGSTSLRKQLLFNFSGLKKILKINNETPQKEQTRKIAEHFGISESEYENAVSSIKGREASLDTPVNDEKNITLVDTLNGSDGNFADIMANKEETFYRNKIFQESMSILDERQKNILIERYLKDNKATLEDLSKKYNISKERIRQIEESAIKKLKKFAEEYDK